MLNQKPPEGHSNIIQLSDFYFWHSIKRLHTLLGTTFYFKFKHIVNLFEGITINFENFDNKYRLLDHISGLAEIFQKSHIIWFIWWKFVTWNSFLIWFTHVYALFARNSSLQMFKMIVFDSNCYDEYRLFTIFLVNPKKFQKLHIIRFIW